MKYLVPILQDAWVRHEAVIEADSKEEAAEIAYRAWKEGDDDIKFEEVDSTTFDEICDPRDDLDAIEEVDEKEEADAKV